MNVLKLKSNYHKIMNILLNHINSIIGAFAVVIGIIIPANNIIQFGTIGGCSDAMSLGFLVSGIVLLGATHFVDKSNFNNKSLFFLVVLILSYFILLPTGYIIQSFYGLAGQFDKCSMFVG